jgi:choline dehydrogenase-like flavoprotein
MESGGTKPDPAADALNSGDVESPDGYQAETLQLGRRRQVGGTSNLWNHELRGGKEKFIRYVALDAIDFEERDWIPLSGWPFSKEHLLPFYNRAHRFCGIGPCSWSASAWRRSSSSAVSWDGPSVESVVSQFGSADLFLKEYRSELHSAGNVFLFSKSTLLGLKQEAARPGIISAAKVAGPGGHHFLVKARQFVLAAGGLENARILLLNESTRPGGPGNRHDMVGRCFMDHPSIVLGTLFPSSDVIYDHAIFYDQHYVDGVPIMGKLRLREEVMRRERLLNSCAVLVPHFRNLRSNLSPVAEYMMAKGRRMLSKRRQLVYRSAKLNTNGDSKLSWRQKLLENCYSECVCGWSRLSNKGQRFGKIGVRSLVEQSPHPNNRITLGDDMDSLGQRRAKLHWRWSELDLLSIRRTQEIFQHDFAAVNIGTFVPSEEMEHGPPHAFQSPHHFLGTTRMHEDPRKGVVDANCCVHGMKNLFVAGSSVFPTGGFANPTLTIIALALRLADHLDTLFHS